jgi:hypothetical protein
MIVFEGPCNAHEHVWTIPDVLCEVRICIGGRRVTREMQRKSVTTVRTVITSFQVGCAKSIRSERIRRQQDCDVKSSFQVQHDRRLEHDEDRVRSRLQANDRLVRIHSYPEMVAKLFRGARSVRFAANMFNWLRQGSTSRKGFVPTVLPKGPSVLLVEDNGWNGDICPASHSSCERMYAYFVIRDTPKRVRLMGDGP